MRELEALTKLAQEGAREAGGAIMAHYGALDFRLKSDASPLTKADEESHAILTRKLSRTPYPISSEEAILPYEARRNLKRFWLIDPLDGTKDFLAQNGQFVVSVALIEGQRPIVGVLYAPALDVIYSAWLGGGASKNSAKLVPKAGKEHVALASVHHSNAAFSDFVARHDLAVESVGSALKFGILSEGEAGIYPRFEGSSTWDIAAGDLILKEAGGIVIDLSTKSEPLYNQESHRNHHFIALSPALYQRGGVDSWLGA